MDLKFKKISGFDRGILYRLLLDAYSFDDRYRECCEQDWIDKDGSVAICFIRCWHWPSNGEGKNYSRYQRL